MSKRIFSKLFLVSFLALTGISASAQEGEYGSYTPYSIFGVGNLSNHASAYTRSMAGAGIASRNASYINSLNPAAVTARDSLAFMVDFSLFNDNTIFSQDIDGTKLKSASNITNMGAMSISFPLFNTTAMMIGLTPYSATGYKYSFLETDKTLIAQNGNIAYTDYGQGSLYKLYGAVGTTFWKKFSIGAELDYYFGNYEKIYSESFAKSGYNQVQDTYDMTLHAVGAKIGAQYEFKAGKDWKVGVGATYSFDSRLKGIVDYTHLAVGTAENVTVSSLSDTLSKSSPVKLAGEFGVGISVYKGEKFRASLDYTLSDWSNTNIDSKSGFAISSSELPFLAGKRHSIKGGIEYTPNRNDIRYYTNRISYRGGAYYNNEYYKVAGNEIHNFGITLGATLPIYQWRNGLTVALDLGQRGTLQNSLVRERYFRISVGVNLADIWFRRFQYE